MPGRARIAVVGGGLMGHGIAQVFASAGHSVRITDPNAEARTRILPRIGANLDDLGLERESLSRVEIHESVIDTVARADWVIEAAPEDLTLKQAIFEQIERAAPVAAILASNTSVIPITQIMANVARKERGLGTHWWNPPYLVPLVEVVRMSETSDATVAATIRLLESVGKRPVEVKKESAIVFNTRSGGRRSRSSPRACAMRRLSTPSSSRVSAPGSRCLVRWRTPIWWEPT
jgi:3-hydroxybutyryl-CoA dehydrogenase